jgi:hypothetical protein
MSTSKAVKMVESTPVLVFTKFHKLPPELRILIWRFATNHQRTITIRDVGGSGPQRTGRFATHNAREVPGVLLANSEARATALKYYALQFGPQFNGNPIYFNYNADGLCFPNFNDLDAFYGLLSRGLFSLVTRPAELHATPVHLELEDNLKRLMIGSSNIYMRDWLLERFWHVDEVYIEIPRTPAQDWDTALVGLVSKWEVASNGRSTPKITKITFQKLLSLIRVEMVITYLIFDDCQQANIKQAKDPKIKAEKARTAAQATSKETSLALTVAKN